MNGVLSARNHGLDTLRALAITLVFAYHYMVFVSRQPTFGWVSVVGWVGVDLFFVLSGYLIANQLFEGMARGQQVSLTRFYARRALRTLPVFWVCWPRTFYGPQ
jgi:peptidoglycan/LPS O-acetylase OafA/YrhL